MHLSPRSALWPLSASIAGSPGLIHKRQSNDIFDWATVKPSHHLTYYDCYTDFKCARLNVPLDWTKHNSTAPVNSNDTSQIATIAIVTLPATVPHTDPSFGGTVLINPGGPGGSGTEFVHELGPYLQGLLEGERHYEILGFDPRGMALSTPRAECYDNAATRAADILQQNAMSPIQSGTEALEHHYQLAKGLSTLCGNKAGPDSIFSHMSTASVARDMLEIVHRVDQQRHGSSNCSTRAGHEKPKLQYIGFSYGSVLGNVFASMFPGHVGRMVLDGIADADDFMKGTWKKNLDDAELVADHFYETCFQSGTGCPLRKDSDRSAADIRSRIDTLLSSLETHPISTIHDGHVRLITSLMIRDSFRRALYNPLVDYTNLATILAQTLAGDYTLLLQNTQIGKVDLDAFCDSVDSDSTYPPPDDSSNDGGMGVLCGDVHLHADDRTLSWAEDIVTHLTNQSSTIGEAWSKIPISCIDWPFQPKYAFSGPIGSPAPNPELPNTTPAAPLLILSTRHDHATPLRNAYALSRVHEGSAVLVQESVGHCALLASVSQCTRGVLQDYFGSGIVPTNNTVCEEDCSPSIPGSPCEGFA